MKKLFLCLALVASSSHAFFKDGNKLLSEMNSDSPTQISQAISMGYVTGVVDALMGITICPPQNVTAGQMRDMVKNYLDNTPAIRHIPANQVISHVMSSVWPCAKPGTGKSL